MGIGDKIRDAIPFLRKPVHLPPAVVRGLRPVRSPDLKWRTEGPDDLIVIYSPRPKDQFWVAWLAKQAGEPPERKTELDELSSRVWNMCDGTNKVSDICRKMADEYKLGERQVEVSVLQFLNILRAKRFVGLTEEDKMKVDVAAGRVKATHALSNKTDGNSSDAKQRTSNRRSKSQKRH